MSEESLRQLDWPWLIDRLRQELRTVPARERCHDLIWQSAPEAARRTMEEVEEARQLLVQGHALPLGTPPDIRPHQPRIEKGAVLRPEELLEIASWMETIETIRRFLIARRALAPRLHRHVEAAPGLSHLIYEIRSCVDEKGEVRDEASPELASSRRKAKRLHEQIHRKLNDYLSAAEYQDLLQDRFYTVKEDRYVLPVKTGQRGFVEGIVLGSSNSGATLFIEPREIVELNNSHKLALLEAQREIDRVLREVCEHIQEDAPQIERGHAFLTRMDLIQARALFAEALQGTIPSMETGKGLQILQGRHPLLLLTRTRAVPNDILVQPPTRTLLITGPNAGGKTVVLKTVGLMALMVRAGLAVPAAPGTNIPFFASIFSDIGDNQSLQEDRSTFSGHIQRVVDFLDRAQHPSLALLDEILIGTDPEEGSALAQANLEHLTEAGVLTLATTHFLSLKAMAASHPGVRNASLGFDPETFEPTYRLADGLPGSSNALHIAERFGLPDGILERARSLLGETGSDLQTLLLEIQRTRRATEEERDRCRILREEAEELRNALAEKQMRLAEREREVKRKYRERLEAAFQEALRELARLRRTSGSTRASATIAHRAVTEHRRGVFAEEGLFHEPPPLATPEEQLDWSRASEGDDVYLPALDAQGRLLGLPDRKGNVTVEAQGFRMQVKADQVCRPRLQRKVIRPRSAPAAKGRPPSWKLEASAAGGEEARDRCDLRGLTADEALDRVSQSLDRAFRGQESRLVLIHGLGKGILRNAVRQYLEETPYPLRFRPGRREEGGDGVTVVEFGSGDEPFG